MPSLPEQALLEWRTNKSEGLSPEEVAKRDERAEIIAGVTIAIVGIVLICLWVVHRHQKYKAALAREAAAQEAEVAAYHARLEYIEDWRQNQGDSVPLAGALNNPRLGRSQFTAQTLTGLPQEPMTNSRFAESIARRGTSLFGRPEFYPNGYRSFDTNVRSNLEPTPFEPASQGKLEDANAQFSPPTLHLEARSAPARMQGNGAPSINQFKRHNLRSQSVVFGTPSQPLQSPGLRNRSSSMSATACRPPPRPQRLGAQFNARLDRESMDPSYASALSLQFSGLKIRPEQPDASSAPHATALTGQLANLELRDETDRSTAPYAMYMTQRFTGLNLGSESASPPRTNFGARAGTENDMEMTDFTKPRPNFL